jgi:hypothetical protein
MMTYRDSVPDLAGHLLADALRGLAAHLLVHSLLDVGALGVQGLLALGGVDGAGRVDDLHAALLVGDLAALLLHHLLHLGTEYAAQPPDAPGGRICCSTTCCTWGAKEHAALKGQCHEMDIF